MNIYELMFILQFITVVGILLVKIYNLMSAGEFYSMKMGFMLFIGFFLAYGVGLIIMLINHSYHLYTMLFTLESYFAPFNVLFIFGELAFMTFKQMRKPVTSYKALPRIR